MYILLASFLFHYYGYGYYLVLSVLLFVSAVARVRMHSSQSGQKNTRTPSQFGRSKPVTGRGEGFV